MKSEKVEVVRCRDCKHCARYQIGDNGFCILNDMMVKMSWCCADGEKKEESET